MKALGFEIVASSIVAGWIGIAAGTVSTLLGMPVVPADAPTVVVAEVVVHQEHARADVPSHTLYALLVNGR